MTSPFTAQATSLAEVAPDGSPSIYVPVSPENPAGLLLPAVVQVGQYGCVRTGGAITPESVLAACREGLIPMRQRGVLNWYLPEPRGVLLPERLHVPHSLRRVVRRYEIRVDTAFAEVIDRCADRGPDDLLWITDEVRATFLALHRRGWAHSVETWTRPDAGVPARLVGGLYGVSIGRYFGGESMFSRESGAGKVALVGLNRILSHGTEAVPDSGTDALIDCQWITPFVEAFGAIRVGTEEYMARLERALVAPPPSEFSAASHAKRGSS